MVSRSAEAQETRSILLIDDEEVIHASVGKVLGRAGYHVESTFLAKEGLNKLREERFDLVITDLMMPKMNGIELLEALQTHKVRVPIIMITGYPTIRTALQAMRLGAVDYLAKPFTRKELLAPIRRALSQVDEQARNNFAERCRPAASKDLIPGACLVLPHHSWARFEQDGTFLVGVEASFLRGIGPVTEIISPDRDDLVEQGLFGITLTDENDEEHSVALPLSGIVEAVNIGVITEADRLGGTTWLLQIMPSHLDTELENLVVVE